MPGGWRLARSLAAAARRRQAAARGSKNSDEAGGMIDDYQNYKRVDKYLSAATINEVDSTYDMLDRLSGGAGMQGFQTALFMAGNEGQKAIIEQMGLDAFQEAASIHNEGGDAGGELLAMCPHPEAVEEILMEAGSVIADEVESAWPDWM